MPRKHASKALAAPNPFEAFKLAVYRFGVAELDALQARRCGPAAGVAQEHKEAGRGTPGSRI